MNKLRKPILALFAVIFSYSFNSTAANKPTYSKSYIENAIYAYQAVKEANNGGVYDLSDERQYRHLADTMKKSSCVSNQAMWRDLKQIRANHIRFGGPGQVVSKNDDNPDGIIEPYNETTSIYPLNEEHTQWGATALSSVPGGTEYSCVTLQIWIVGPGINEPVGEGASHDLSCGVNFQLDAETMTLTAQQVEGLDSGELRLVPMLSYMYKEIDGPAKQGTGQLPPITSNVPKLMKVQEPTQKQANVGKPYIKVCISRSQQNDCDYDYTNASKELILPLKGQITYNNKILDPTDPRYLGEASISAVNTTTGGNCVESHDVGKTFFQDPNTTWDAGGGTVLDWNIPAADIGKIIGCANNGAKMDFVQVMTLQLESANGIAFPIGTSITSETDELAGPSVFKMPYLETYSGCLAEDTEITLADNKGTMQVSSEELFDGSNPVLTEGSPTGKLWVQGNTIGMELRLAYKVSDDKGNVLILTEEHPIYAKNPGSNIGAWIFTKDLLKDAELTTLDGPSKVVSIDRINYEKKVYNLFVGNEDGSDVPQGQMNFYANNILVGDGNMQTRMIQDAKGLNCGT